MLQCFRKSFLDGSQVSSRSSQTARVTHLFGDAWFNRLRYPILLVALLTLLAAAWAGLLRIGWMLPTTSDLATSHGPLMISGFLGTLIGLERAVALAAFGPTSRRSFRAWARSPACSGFRSAPGC